MAKYKHYDCSHGKFILIGLDKHILHDSFERTRHGTIDNDLDLDWSAVDGFARGCFKELSQTVKKQANGTGTA